MPVANNSLCFLLSVVFVATYHTAIVSPSRPLFRSTDVDLEGIIVKDSGPSLGGGHRLSGTDGLEATKEEYSRASPAERHGLPTKDDGSTLGERKDAGGSRCPVSMLSPAKDELGERKNTKNSRSRGVQGRGSRSGLSPVLGESKNSGPSGCQNKLSPLVARKDTASPRPAASPPMAALGAKKVSSLGVSDGNHRFTTFAGIKKSGPSAPGVGH